MLSCAVLMLIVGLADLPGMAAEVETEARELTAQTEVTPAFLADLREFSGDAERLSAALREAGVEQDLPDIFHGIAADARERAAELERADTQTEQDVALTHLRVLLDDAILIAPMAAAAAADAAAEKNLAER
jgi:hypothetical protein